MPNENEIYQNDRIAKLQAEVTRLQAEIEQGERLLEAEQAELQAQRVKHEQEKAQLAEACEIAMQRRSEAEQRADRAENRAALFKQAADSAVQTIAQLWGLIQQQPDPPHSSETPKGYPIIGESRGE